MNKCKHCKKEIVKIVGRWYHTKSGNWFCFLNKAEPKELIK